MSAPTAHDSNRQAQSGRVRPILFALGLRPDWGLYMPHLLQLARETNSGIHVLETGAPLGTGTFTSNTVMNKAEPTVPTEAEVLGSTEPIQRRTDPGEVTPEPVSHGPGDMGTGDQATALVGEPWSVPPESAPYQPAPNDALHADTHPARLEPSRAPSAAPQPGDPTLAWPDTVASTVQVNEFVESLVRYFQAAGLTASGDWQPDFDRTLLGEYAQRIGAEIIAVPKRGFPASLLQNAYVTELERQGFRIVLLEEVSQEELNALKQRTAEGSAATPNPQEA